jgi:hypothetical protein
MFRRPYVGLAAIAVALLAAAAAHAQSRGKSSKDQDSFFRCKDASGQTRFGDRMPPECVGLDTEVLNERGMVIRIIEGTKSKEERLAREAAEQKARKEQIAREQRDRMLIDTYLSVADIERLRDQRLDELVSKYRVTEQNIKNLRERQVRLQQQIARFRPYNEKSNAPPLPDHLAEEMVNTVNGIRVYEEELARNKQEQAELKAAFEEDIKRFKELKGIK